MDPAERSTPAAIREALTEFGGTNQFGGAHWRVVLAQERLCLRGGIFKHMPTGNVKSFEIDPKTFRLEYRDVRPERVETGIREVPKYPVKGWIMERWFPPHMYGTPQDWERVKSSDGMTPMMGPFPYRGEYFMLAGPWQEMPGIDDLRKAISLHIREENARPASYKVMLQQELDADTEREEKAYKAHMEALQHFFQSEVDPIRKGTSLAAGRIRNELAEQVGDRSHQGVA